MGRWRAARLRVCTKLLGIRPPKTLAVHRLGAGRFGVHEPTVSYTAKGGGGHHRGQRGDAGGRLEPLLDRVHTTALATTSSTSVNRSCRSPSRCRSGPDRRLRPPRLCELLERILAGVPPVVGVRGGGPEPHGLFCFVMFSFPGYCGGQGPAMPPACRRDRGSRGR